MRACRKRIRSVLPEGHDVISLVAWPLMGIGEFSTPWEKPGGPISRSLFVPDNMINPHPRFGTLTRNIRKRRGKKVQIQIPLYQDEKTKEGPLGDAKVYSVVSQDNQSSEETKEIYMDAMGFGMGMCCLQITFQARDITESRYLYDQLAVMCPVMLALSAGCPIQRGALCDTDVRWSTIAQSVDCRTPFELGATDKSAKMSNGEVPQRGKMRIRKSRYESVDLFMSSSEKLKPEYNDLSLEIDQPTFDMLTARGMD